MQHVQVFHFTYIPLCPKAAVSICSLVCWLLRWLLLWDSGNEWYSLTQCSRPIFSQVTVNLFHLRTYSLQHPALVTFADENKETSVLIYGLTYILVFQFLFYFKFSILTHRNKTVHVILPVMFFHLVNVTIYGPYCYIKINDRFWTDECFELWEKTFFFPQGFHHFNA